MHIVWGVGSSIGGVFEPAGVDISKGVYSGQWLKDQSNPAYANDEDMKLYVAKLKQYGGSFNPADQNAAAGWYRLLRHQEPVRADEAADPSGLHGCGAQHRDIRRCRCCSTASR